MGELPAADENETIQKLPNDIILDDIIPRFPLKQAVGCRLLNKYFYNNIPVTKLLSSTYPPITFRHTSGDRITVISSPLGTATFPNNYVRILDSCNGILLLLETVADSPYHKDKKYYLFNPFTGGIKLLSHHEIHSGVNQGFAITSSSSSSFDFKIVCLYTNNSVNPVRSRLYFYVYHVPLGKSTLERKHFYFDYRGSFRVGFQRPVYAHSRLHWLGSGSTAIASFDTESKRVRIMAGPLRRALQDRVDHWFGLAQGSLHFIRTHGNAIIVHSHNYATREWRVAHKIEMPSDLTSVNRGMVVEFFDGQSVFCKTTSHAWRHVQDIYVHDLSMGEWDKIGETEESYNWHCKQFVPTTARVSDVYVSSFKRTARLGRILRRMQKILLGG